MEILGLLDTLEAMILDGFKFPFSKRTVLNEEKLLAIIDKMRLVVQGGGDFAKKAIGGERQGIKKPEALDELMPKRPSARPVAEAQGGDVEGKAIEVLQQAYSIAKDVRHGANKYADEVLSNLEATTSRVIRAIRAGRDRLNNVIGEGKTEEPKSISEILTKEDKKEEKGS